MKTTSILLCSIPFVIGFAAACGGAPKPAVAPVPEPTTEPVAAPSSTPVPAASAAPAPTASAVPTPPPETPKKSGGRPQAVYTDTTDLNTVGYDGAAFFLANTGAELIIPVGAMREPRNIKFVVDKKAQGSSGRLGVVYDLTVQIPEMEYRVGEESPSQPVQSIGDDFTIKLPLPAGATNGNIAVETITDAGKGKHKSTWAIVAPAETEKEHFEHGVAITKRAVFRMHMLPDGHVHLTSAAPKGN